MDLIEVGKRIRRRREKLGWTAQKLAVMSELTPSFISRVESGKTETSHASLLKIAGALGLSLEKLYETMSNVIDAVPDFRMIPLLDYVQAGQWRTVDATMKDEWMREVIPVNMDYPPSIFSMKISGDSMEPRFKNGDIVVIDPTMQPRPGCFVVATDEHGDATFKQYRSLGRTENGSEAFELIPLNSMYAPLRSDRQQIAIVGVMREHRIFDR